ncbi:Protein ae7 [Stygiomarasmius scandens]|uniref:Protein ae7 n=1 Tax=Marasmiellus scandens TaxID=2682957 RepID=A0ABR1J8Z8_9AGAR
MPSEIFNPNPTIFRTEKVSSSRLAQKKSLWIDDEEDTDIDEENNEIEAIDQDEIFDLIRYIYDPEHPNTLEELRVVSAPQITISGNLIKVEFTPTVPHCGMSTVIGLSIRVRLLRSLPSRFKVDIVVKPGSHQSEHAVNKQLNDKERVAAALENPTLIKTLEETLEGANRRGRVD